MAFVVSGVRRGSQGDCYVITGSFTSSPGDSTFTFTHGMNYIVDDQLQLHGLVDSTSPKTTHSNGVCTAIWSDTLGASGDFCFVGK